MKERITSRQNPRIKRVCSLTEKKGRRAEGLFRFDGIKLLKEALAASVELKEIYLREPISDELLHLLDSAESSGRLKDVAVITVPDSVFEKLSEEQSPEGVITVARPLEQLHQAVGAEELLSVIGTSERILLAEALRDPGNLGTVMRSCAALGIDRLILSEDCADLYHPRTLRSAMGAMFRMPTVSVGGKDLSEAVGVLRRSGRRVYAAALREEAVALGSFSLRGGDCFVIGNEGHGLCDATVAACDRAVIIPMREGNESLNAAAAAAICIWETVRA